MKKKIILIIIFWIIFLIFCLLSIKDSQFNAFVNWHIYLPNIKEEEIVYDNFFREGNTISILTIGNYNAVEKLIKKNNFKIINAENIDEISEKIQIFYNSLNSDGKNSFDNNIDIENIINLPKKIIIYLRVKIMINLLLYYY